jgi:fatty acid desaturase
MNPESPVAARAHDAASARLVAGGLCGAALLAAVNLVARAHLPTAALLPLLIAQGVWLYRLYVIAHEGAHGKLFTNPTANALCATLLLLPIGAPFTIYRKIHLFHHGANRKDARHSALDHFRVRGPVSRGRRRWYRVVWLFYVFGAGFFLHSLVTIAIFLLVPARWAVKIDPVFARFAPAARLRAWIEGLAALGLHATVAALAGARGWALLLGGPLLVFAWLFSLLLYVFHYGTSVGPDVRWNERALPPQRVLSWLLLNFNEHVTHHADPRIPWYALPARRQALPAAFVGNQDARTLWAAIWQQRRGPVLVARERPPEPTP